ncbi:MAG: hypothetical protein Q9184_007848, partial [Pyrenodesmia sp. 2 TL-2023]
NTKAKKKRNRDADKTLRGPSEKWLLPGEPQTLMSPSEEDCKAKAKDNLDELARKMEEEKEGRSEEQTEYNTAANETDE